jgi:hypothetical protein
VVFTDYVWQGLLPYRDFILDMNEYSAFMLMGVSGVLFGRAYDFRTEIGASRRSRGKRTYEGKKPLVDIHVYQHDFLYPVLFLVFFLFCNQITQRYTGNVLEGRYRMDADHASTILLKDGGVYCEKDNEPAQLGWYAISGNLLDGFYFRIMTEQRWEERCQALRPFFEKERRFRKRGRSVLFDDRVAGWKWVMWTILEMRGKRTAQQVWEVVSEETRTLETQGA